MPAKDYINIIDVIIVMWKLLEGDLTGIYNYDLPFNIIFELTKVDKNSIKKSLAINF